MTDEMMDPENIMNGISKELDTVLKAMAKAKTPEEKLAYSETVRNLCESLGVFLRAISDVLPYEEGTPMDF